MRTPLVALGVAGVASLAWLLCWSPESPPAPPAPTPLATQPEVGAAPAPIEAARGRAADAARDGRDAHALSPDADTQAEPEARAPLLPAIAEVRAAATGALVPSFSYRFTAGSLRSFGACEGGRAGLDLPWATTGDLLIESDGMEPRRFEALALPPRSAPPVVLEVYLRRARVTEGVTLLVHDVDRRPLPSVRVDAFALTDAADAAGAWHLNAPLWSRAASSPGGRYTLPPLAPGSYGVRLRAVDAAGAPLPHAAFRRVFEFTGSNGFREDVTLEPACALRLDLVRPDGLPFDPETRGPVTVTLRLAAEPALSRRWVCAGRDGAPSITAIDRLPGPSPVWLAEAVAPGAYSLELGVAGRVLARKTLLLSASTQTERVVVP